MPRSSANVDVVDLLESYLSLAKNSGFSSVAIAMVCHHEESRGALACYDYAGDLSLQKGTLEAVDKLGNEISGAISHWKLPDRDTLLGADYVCYDTARGPLGFDFLNWLIDAEMTRIREGAPAPLKVGFWAGRSDELVGDPLVHVRRQHWIKNVFRPILQLLGAVEDAKAIRGRQKETYVPRDICAAARAGEAVPRLRAPELEMPCGAVTITLRESCYWSHRNSSIVDWVQFALDLRRQGERVIFVRDTEKADEQIDEWETCPLASKNILARFALYENSKANLFVSNGPATLALYGSKPWLQFTPVEKDGAMFIGNTGKFWERSMGVPVGEQFPWSAPDQRIIWLHGPETYEGIKWAYETWMTNKSR